MGSSAPSRWRLGCFPISALITSYTRATLLPHLQNTRSYRARTCVCVSWSPRPRPRPRRNFFKTIQNDTKQDKTIRLDTIVSGIFCAARQPLQDTVSGHAIGSISCEHRLQCPPTKATQATSLHVIAVEQKNIKHSNGTINANIPDTVDADRLSSFDRYPLRSRPTE